MSNVDHVVKASAQAGHEVKPIGAFGCFNTPSPLSRTDPADGKLKMPGPAATALAAKPALPAGRQPLFRR
jgi:hypothetical protein